MIVFRKNLQKWQSFWKKLQKCQFLETIADISRFWPVFLASDLILKNMDTVRNLN